MNFLNTIYMLKMKILSRYHSLGLLSIFLHAKAWTQHLHPHPERYHSMRPGFFLFDLILYNQQSFSYVGTGLPGLNQCWARINVSCSRTQPIDACEARTSGISVSSQALYHWATGLPFEPKKKCGWLNWGPNKTIASLNITVSSLSKVGKMPANKHICHASGIYQEIQGNTGNQWEILANMIYNPGIFTLNI